MTGQHHVSVGPPGELAVGWALHVLEPAEEILVAAHLPDCPDCARTVAKTELVGAVLGLCVPEVVPSAELEQRVLAVTATAQAWPVLPRAPSTCRATGRSSGTPAASPLRQAPHGHPRQEPRCVPETLVLISIALLVFTCTFAILLYAIP